MYYPSAAQLVAKKFSSISPYRRASCELLFAERELNSYREASEARDNSDLTLMNV
jgi:hypothetical protein